MPQTLRVVLISVAAAVACSLAIALVVVGAERPAVLLGAPAASASTTTVEPGILTSGDATVSKKPDIAFVYAGVDSQQPTAAAAQSDLANKAARLIARAQALGIADRDINTSGYSVAPYYTSGEQTIAGYRASEQLQLKWHSVDTIGKTLDALVQEGGATQVSVSFGLADPKAARAEARTLAIADARSRAQAMAAAAGVRLGQVILVSDLTMSGYTSAGYDIRAATPAATQLPVGELSIAVTVEVDYSIG
ncbi:MAG: SIMPL domain-containing protein [Candidatus Dormiibacterota bacterium]